MGFFSCTASDKDRKALLHICSPGVSQGRVRCGAGVVAGVQSLAQPHEDQGMRCALLLAVGVAQSGDTSTLELGAGGAHSQGLPLCSGLPACPIRSTEGPPGPPPSLKDTGQG